MFTVFFFFFKPVLAGVFYEVGSPVAGLVKRLSFTFKSKSKTLGPEILCSLQSGVSGFNGRGCTLRNVAVRKSQEESLQRRNETPEL